MCKHFVSESELGAALESKQPRRGVFLNYPELNERAIQRVLQHGALGEVRCRVGADEAVYVSSKRAFTRPFEVVPSEFVAHNSCQ